MKISNHLIHHIHYVHAISKLVELHKQFNSKNAMFLYIFIAIVIWPIWMFVFIYFINVKSKEYTVSKYFHHITACYGCPKTLHMLVYMHAS
jgi:hypothetical protein